jgi:endonuclease/exonuclease/phosphatase (EEP) superfamily protein YafD
LPITRRAAAIRLRRLIDEVRLLTSAFPDLRDAFDPDELPIDFILKRDAQAKRAVTPNSAASALAAAGRPRPARDLQRGRGKQPFSDD